MGMRLAGPVAYAGGGGLGLFNLPTGKDCYREMMVFPKALYVATTFPKNR